MKLLRAREVQEMVGISEPTLYTWQREGRFPLAIRIGPGATRWREDEVEEWIEARDRVQVAAIVA